jgi:putative two-component system response regulator
MNLLHLAEAVPLENARILLVDDEPAMVRSLETILERAHYDDVVATTDPRAAGELFSGVEPDLVLLDLHMPRMDGFAVLAELRKRTLPGSYVPVLVVTGDVSPDARRRALAAGAKDFIGKPFDPPEIVLRIANFLEARRLHLELQRQNLALESSVARRTRELERAQLEVLERLAAAGEFRDDDTGRHTQRVGEMAVRLGSALGLEEDTLDMLRWTAPLHDVGKIGIPDRILLKHGALTAEEWAVMRSHTTIGAAILAGGGSPMIRMAERIARSHHERWDGDGYPDGLAGDAIPLEARVVAIADMFDAVTHRRPYREALPMDRVVAMLHEQRGQHFDPDVLDAFLAIAPWEDAHRVGSALRSA